MLSGNLKHKVELHKRTGAENQIDWEFYKTVNAQILFKSGANVIQSYQYTNLKTLTIKIRNRKDIDSTMRVKIDNEMFDIVHLQTIGGYNGDIIIDLILTI